MFITPLFAVIYPPRLSGFGLVAPGSAQSRVVCGVAFCFEPVVDPAGLVAAGASDSVQALFVAPGPACDRLKGSGREPALERSCWIELDQRIGRGRRRDRLAP